MRKGLHHLGLFTSTVFKEFFSDDILKYSASLAYYTVFAIAPMLIIVSTLTGIFFGEEAINGEVYHQLKDLVGHGVAVQIQELIKNIRPAGNSFIKTVVSIIVLLIAATSVFGEIQDSLNKIWGLRVKTTRIWWKLILTRLLSFSLIISIGLILIASIILNALLSAFGNFLSNYFHQFSLYFIETSEALLSFVIEAFLFSLLFKILPDAKIRWKDAFFGGLVTAIFFTLGKQAIGFYIGKSNLKTLYGAAGSIIIFMIFVYYSSIILYLGAECTKVYANLYGRKIKPNEYAEWVEIEKKHTDAPHLKNKELN